MFEEVVGSVDGLSIDPGGRNIFAKRDDLSASIQVGELDNRLKWTQRGEQGLQGKRTGRDEWITAFRRQMGAVSIAVTVAKSCSSAKVRCRLETGTVFEANGRAIKNTWLYTTRRYKHHACRHTCPALIP